MNEGIHYSFKYFTSMRLTNRIATDVEMNNSELNNLQTLAAEIRFMTLTTTCKYIVCIVNTNVSQTVKISDTSSLVKKVS